MTLLLGHGLLSRSSAIAREQAPTADAKALTIAQTLAQTPESDEGTTDETEKKISYGELLKKIDNGEVQELELDQIKGIAKVKLKSDAEDDKPHEVKVFANDRNLDLQERLMANKVTWEATSTADNSAITSFATTAFVGLLIIFAMLMLLRKSASSGGGAMSFGGGDSSSLLLEELLKRGQEL